jgi:hypothetical protein
VKQNGPEDSCKMSDGIPWGVRAILQLSHFLVC